jgi:hypothetical protein
MGRLLLLLGGGHESQSAGILQQVVSARSAERLGSEESFLQH